MSTNQQDSFETRLEKMKNGESVRMSTAEVKRMKMDSSNDWWFHWGSVFEPNVIGLGMGIYQVTRKEKYT